MSFPETSSGLLEQLRGELVEVIAPVDPGVGARGFVENGTEPVVLQHRHGATSGFNQEIVLARREPEQLKTFLQPGVVQRFLVPLLPGRTSRRVRAAASTSDK